MARNQFEVDLASSILSEIESQEPPQKKPQSAREFVSENITRINELIKRGWRTEEIAARLNDGGVKISPQSLKAYLKQQKSAKRKVEK